MNMGLRLFPVVVIIGSMSAVDPANIVVGLVENDAAFEAKIRAELEKVQEVREIRSWHSAEIFWRDSRGRGIDLLFLDIKLPGMDGVELAGRIAERDPDTGIVMLSNLNSDHLIFQALRNGAIGYLLKSELGDIGETVRTILSGGATITPTIALRVLTSFRKSNPVLDGGLTDREKQILELMVSGKTIARVADTVGISVNTVNHHAKNIYRKLNVHNRTELARKAAEAGLL